MEQSRNSVTVAKSSRCRRVEIDVSLCALVIGGDGGRITRLQRPRKRSLLFGEKYILHNILPVVILGGLMQKVADRIRQRLCLVVIVHGC